MFVHAFVCYLTTRMRLVYNFTNSHTHTHTPLEHSLALMPTSRDAVIKFFGHWSLTIPA